MSNHRRHWPQAKEPELADLASALL
jgi:hypothetical protein